jgi:hypothetical protein
VGFQRLERALVRFLPVRRTRATPDAERDVSTARHCATLVGIAARRGPFRGNCLQRSLTLWWLLSRQSVPAEVRVGVRTVSGKLEAHAWVEVRGQIIADRADVRQQYAAFDRALLSPSSN